MQIRENMGVASLVLSIVGCVVGGLSAIVSWLLYYFVGMGGHAMLPIAGLVFGVIFISILIQGIALLACLLAIVFAIVGIRKQVKRGMAIAGLVIGCISLLVGLALFLPLVPIFLHVWS